MHILGSGSLLVMGDWILFLVSVSSRVSPTNSERMSPLTYLTDPSGLRIVYEQAASWAYPGFPWNPRLLIVSLGATGGRTLLGFGLHLIVS